VNEAFAEHAALRWAPRQLRSQHPVYVSANTTPVSPYILIPAEQVTLMDREAAQLEAKYNARVRELAGSYGVDLDSLTGVFLVVCV